MNSFYNEGSDKGGNEELHQSSEMNEPKKSRFSSHETLIVMLILVIILAIAAPLMVKYVNDAKDTAIQSNAYAIWILVNSTLLLDEITDEEILEFADKYQYYRMLSELKDGKMKVEKNIMLRIDKFDEQNLYVKMEFKDTELKKVFVSRDLRGSQAAAYGK